MLSGQKVIQFRKDPAPQQAAIQQRRGRLNGSLCSPVAACLGHPGWSHQARVNQDEFTLTTVAEDVAPSGDQALGARRWTFLGQGNGCHLGRELSRGRQLDEHNVIIQEPRVVVGVAND